MRVKYRAAMLQFSENLARRKDWLEAQSRWAQRKPNGMHLVCVIRHRVGLATRPE